VKAAAANEKVPLVWGGDWRAFKDGPHWELPWKFYPKEK
jgi:peptidoglycan L-alanyl-D-glutamate endopeptidase CwlK